MIQPRINDAMMQAGGQTEGLQALLVDKGVTIAQNIIDRFLRGLKSQTLILLGVSLVLIVIGCVWLIWARRCGHSRE